MACFSYPRPGLGSKVRFYVNQYIMYHAQLFFSQWLLGFSLVVLFPYACVPIWRHPYGLYGLI